MQMLEFEQEACGALYNNAIFVHWLPLRNNYFKYNEWFYILIWLRILEDNLLF